MDALHCQEINQADPLAVEDFLENRASLSIAKL
jgi:hypothetical protein